MNIIKQKIYEKRLEILKEDLSIDDKVHGIFNNNYNDILKLLPYELIKSYVDKYGNHSLFWIELSGNLSLPLQFIEDNINSEWNWLGLSMNKNITLEFIYKYKDKFNFDKLSSNKNIIFKVIEKINNINSATTCQDLNLLDLPWDWKSIFLEYKIEKNKDIPGNIYYYNYRQIDEFFNNNIKNWNFKYLCFNNNEDLYDELDWDLISLIKNVSYLEKFKDKINYDYISSNINITYDFIINNLAREWNWDKLSGNPMITTELVENNMDKSWNWNKLSKNEGISIDFIESYNSYDWYNISYNKNITLDIIEKYIDKPLNWTALSINPIITPDFIDSHIDKDWCWINLSYNKSLTLDFIDKHIDKDLDWMNLSYNKSLTLDFILKHNDKEWNWNALSYELFISFKDYLKYKHLNWTHYIFLNKHILEVDNDDEDYIEEAIIYMTKQRIKRITRAATCDPKYKIARKKIKKMFDEV